MQNGDYVLADSLLTVSINNYPHYAKLFNRALARINLKDTSGFCIDLKYSYDRFSDKQALSLYLKSCVKKIDSIAYDKKFSKSEDKLRYMELSVHDKYTNNIWGEYWDLKKNHEKTSLSLNSGIRTQNTNIIATYEYIDNEKVFIISQTPASCDLTTMLQYFEANIVYSNELIEALNKAEKSIVTVYVNAIVDSSGHVKNPQLIKTNQPVDQFIVNEALRVVALDGLLFEAATFNNKKVSSKTVLQVHFKKK